MNVIVVDDERIVLRDEESLVRAVLPEAKATAFLSAREALRFAETEPVDIALLDVDMRGMNGIEMAQRLMELHPRVNVIFCTGYPEYAYDAVSLYCSGYLLKPLTARRRWWRRTAATRSTFRSCGWNNDRILKKRAPAGARFLSRLSPFVPQKLYKNLRGGVK